MKVFGWLSVIGLLGFSLVSAAYMFRYEPFPSSSDNPMEVIFVWDRWEARACMTGMATSHRLLCTADDLDRFTKKKK